MKSKMAAGSVLMALARKSKKKMRYTLPEGERKYFGSLLVGYHALGGLVFAVTGFSDKVLANLYAKFQKLRMPTSPFANLPEKSKGRMGSWDYPGWHETLPVGQTCTDRPGKVYRVDTRRPAWSAGLSRAAN